MKSMFDKLIKALQKNQKPQPSMQLPSMNMEEDDTPPLPTAPPVPPPSAPLPPEPQGSIPPPPPSNPPIPQIPPLPPPEETGGEAPMSFDLDDELVLSIVSELDKDMAEEEKLKRAKEKLNQILQKRAKEGKPLLPGPSYKPGPRSKMAVQPQVAYPKPGPRSRMANPPEPAYRAGPRSRLQALNPSLLVNPPPPPPPEPQTGSNPGPPKRVTDDDISSFLHQWVEHPPERNVQPEPEVMGGNGNGEPVYSSALAKLRAKKAAKNRQSGKGNNPPSLLTTNFLPPENIREIGKDPLPPRPFEDQMHNQRIPEPIIEPRYSEDQFIGRTLKSWSRLLDTHWKTYMDDMFKELWVSPFKCSLISRILLVEIKVFFDCHRLRNFKKTLVTLF